MEECLPFIHWIMDMILLDPDYGLSVEPQRIPKGWLSKEASIKSLCNRIDITRYGHLFLRPIAFRSREVSDLKHAG